MKTASDIFEKNLRENNSSEKTRKYIRQERKISSEICTKYSIGYSLNSWDALNEELKKQY